MFMLHKRKISTVIIALFIFSLLFVMGIISVISIMSFMDYNASIQKRIDKSLKIRVYYFLKIYTDNEATRYEDIITKTNTSLDILGGAVKRAYRAKISLVGRNNTDSLDYYFDSNNGAYYLTKNENIRNIYLSNRDNRAGLPDYINRELMSLDTLDPLMVIIKNSSPFFRLVWIETATNCFKGYPADVLTSPVQYPKGFKFKYSNFYSNKLDNGTTGSDRIKYWSRIYLNAEKELCFSRIYPIFIDGKNICTVGIDIKLNEMFEKILHLRGKAEDRTPLKKYSKDHIYMIFDENGDPVALNEKSLNVFGVDDTSLGRLNIYDTINFNSDNKLFQKLNSAKESEDDESLNLHLITINGESYIYSASVIKSTGWTLVNLIKEKHLRDDMFEKGTEVSVIMKKMVVKYIIAALIFILIFALLAVVILKRYLLLPLQELVYGLKNVSVGNLESAKINKYGYGEMYSAGIAFNDMIDRLFKAGTKIKHYQNHLEELVVERTAKIEERIGIEQMANTISKQFISVISQNEFDSAITEALEKIGLYFDVKHVFINLNIIQDENTEMLNFPQCLLGKCRVDKSVQDVVKKMNCNDKAVVISDISKDTHLKASEIASLEENNISSLVILPMILGGKLRGWLNIVSKENVKNWSKEDIGLLYTISGIILASMERLSYEQCILKEKNAAEKATRAKSTFLANMSHDIRTPIHVILGNTELLKSEFEGESFAKMKLGAIETSGNMLLSLINNILDFSKIESGKIDLSCKNMSVSSLISDLDIFYRNTVNRKGIYLKFNIKDCVSDIIVIDSDYLKRVLVNIISNAIKVTEVGGIDIRISESHDVKNGTSDFIIKITDTGIGIPAGKLDQIFKPFEQVNKVSGTGLGLSIAKSIIYQMGGDITVESEEGKGSTFIIKLYRLIVKSKNELLRSSNGSTDLKWRSCSLAGTNILIADDIKDNRELLFSFLESTGCKCIEADNGLEVVKLLHKEQCDIVVLDMKMPGLNGIETLTEIRKNNKKLPVVILSASAQPGAETVAYNSGCNIFMRKPISRSEFIKAVISLLPEESIKYNALDISCNASKKKLNAGVPREMYDEIRTVFLPEWDEINGSFVITKYREFIKKLIKLGVKYSSSYWDDWINEISVELEAFNLLRIKEIFNDFKKLTDEIEIK